MRDDTPPELLEMRHSIDNIDAALIHLLAERFKQTRKVGELKARFRTRHPRFPGACRLENHRGLPRRIQIQPRHLLRSD